MEAEQEADKSQTISKQEAGLILVFDECHFYIYCFCCCFFSSLPVPLSVNLYTCLLVAYLSCSLYVILD